MVNAPFTQLPHVVLHHLQEELGHSLGRNRQLLGLDHGYTAQTVAAVTAISRNGARQRYNRLADTVTVADI